MNDFFKLVKLNLLFFAYCKILRYTKCIMLVEPVAPVASDKINPDLEQSKIEKVERIIEELFLRLRSYVENSEEFNRQLKTTAYLLCGDQETKEIAIQFLYNYFYSLQTDGHTEDFEDRSLHYRTTSKLYNLLSGSALIQTDMGDVKRFLAARKKFREQEEKLKVHWNKLMGGLVTSLTLLGKVPEVQAADQNRIEHREIKSNPDGLAYVPGLVGPAIQNNNLGLPVDSTGLNLIEKQADYEKGLFCPPPRQYDPKRFDLKNIRTQIDFFKKKLNFSFEDLFKLYSCTGFNDENMEFIVEKLSKLDPERLQKVKHIFTPTYIALIATTHDRLSVYTTIEGQKVGNITNQQRIFMNCLSSALLQASVLSNPNSPLTATGDPDSDNVTFSAEQINEFYLQNQEIDKQMGQMSPESRQWIARSVLSVTKLIPDYQIVKSKNGKSYLSGEELIASKIKDLDKVLQPGDIVIEFGLNGFGGDIWHVIFTNGTGRNFAMNAGGNPKNQNKYYAAFEDEGIDVTRDSSFIILRNPKFKENFDMKVKQELDIDKYILNLIKTNPAVMKFFSTEIDAAALKLNLKPNSTTKIAIAQRFLSGFFYDQVTQGKTLPEAEALLLKYLEGGKIKDEYPVWAFEYYLQINSLVTKPTAPVPFSSPKK